MRISDISVKKLENNELEKELPEFYELKDVVENCLGHINDPVFNHVLNVLKSLQRVTESANERIKNYLKQKIDYATRKELLFLGAVLHDIAKKDTIVKREDGTTSCLNHEEIGAIKSKKILERFELSDKEKNIITDIVKYHGDLHQTINLKNKNLEEDYEKLRKKTSNVFLELIILVLSDILSSQLNESNPEEFKFQTEFYKNVIENY
ncbi:MAG: HD domain-containing protein [Nanoarchaeota archaeon]|nr:HD domain-containing protein [DPANN group archaeon]MBL7116429.1 HD domain-containing protein [Nanoarchaeota archaeon]